MCNQEFCGTLLRNENTSAGIDFLNKINFSLEVVYFVR